MKKTLIIVVSVVAFLVLSAMGARMWLRHKVRTMIEQTVSQSGAGVTMGPIMINLASRSVTVRGIRLTMQNDDTSRRGSTIASLEAKGSVWARGVSYKKRPGGDGKRTIGVALVRVECTDASLVTDGGSGSTTVGLKDAVLEVKDLLTASLRASEVVCGFGDGAADKTRVALHGLLADGIDFEALTAKVDSGKLRTLVIDSISLGGARVESSKNRKIPTPDVTKPMIWQSIQRLPLALDVRRVDFSDVDVVYDELALDGTSPGVVTISDGKGTIENLTNIAEGHERFFTVELTATLMPGSPDGSTSGQGGQMSARCLFPVREGDDHWEITGRVGRLDMRAMNPALEPLMNVRVVSGVMQGLDYHLTGNLRDSHIEMTMPYNDLKVSFLKKNDHSRERGLLTFIADDILLRSDNPGRGARGSLRPGEGNYTHDPRRSMYNFIWRSFVPAIVKTVL